MKKVIPIIGAALTGVFVGVSSSELIRRRPQFLKNAWKNTGEALKTFREAFKEGYRGRLSDDSPESAEDKKLLKPDTALSENG
jgi:hypothetical protein